jgi:hypothetical protein
VKPWRQRVGYSSLFAAIPAVLAAPLGEAHSEVPKPLEANVTELSGGGQGLNPKFGNRALLKLQSKFRLPHQNAPLATFAGNDDCPGKPIPGGNYTAALPYTDSGDTTGANNTVNRLIYYYYYSYDTSGPDHIYSFTVTGIGPNPQIQVTTSSNTFRPIIYVLDSRFGGCPAGTGNTSYSWIAVSHSSTGTATLNSQQISYLPLNVPVSLVIDSTDAQGPGPYTLRMQDVTISPATTCSNPIDCPEFFVRQHYLDFLNREPETGGLAAWLSVLNNCTVGDQVCQHEQRLTTSAAFIRSAEFQLKGYFVFRFYRTAFDRLPDYSEIAANMQSVTGQTPDDVYSRKATFTNSFVQRAEFASLYNGLPNADYVAALLNRYGLASIITPDPAHPDGAGKVTLTQAELVSRLDASTLTRAQVLRAIADSDQVFQIEQKRVFVAMQYYGYLRRTPEPAGYNAWLDYLNAHPEDTHEMVRGFVDSIEYRSRFGAP